MATTNSLSQQLLDLLSTRNFHPEMLDKSGNPANADDAKTFTFDYVSGTGKNYGTMVIMLDVDNDMKILYGDNLGRTMEGDDKNEFFDFLQHLNQKATSNRWTHTTADLSQLKHLQQGLAAIQEGLFEGYYGNKKISWAGNQTEARLMIRHNRDLSETDARYRHVESIYIETADNERFKLGFKSLSGARAMLEHVRQGGKPYDVRGCHITEMINEIAVLNRFNRASANRILEGVTQELVTEAQAYYKNLRENIKHMATSRGYKNYFETWHPATINEQDAIVDNIKTLFIEQTIDSRIEDALPLLARIQQKGREMKEAEIFESWINNLAEGTWTLPETPEQLNKLQELMSKDLIVGPDATNATEQLYGLVGDDVLFDRLQDLAARDARANAWNDTEVIARLQELGIELPQTSAEPAAPAPDAAAAPAPVAQEPAPPVAEQLNKMRKDAGLPVVEGVLRDDTGGTLQHICDRFTREVNDFRENGELNDDLYHALYDYYFDDMPYGTKKARDGDPYEWVSQRFADDLGINEGDNPATFEVVSGFDAPTVEGTCNMTHEGEYCPEHGLVECGTVAGGMAPVMGAMEENVFDKPKHDDAINYNAAITGAYYESKEGDALLDRIKSLALIK
jgi:hypothetical protein